MNRAKRIKLYSAALTALNGANRREVAEWFDHDAWVNTITQRRACLALDLAELIGEELDEQAEIQSRGKK